jgi:glucoamylase
VTTTPFSRASAKTQRAGSIAVSDTIYNHIRIDANLQNAAQHMFTLMMRNVASDGFGFVHRYDDESSERTSRPGCIIASPSYGANTPDVNQDYVYNWTRDAALTALEIAAANIATAPGQGVEALIDYVTFAQTCQNNANTKDFQHPSRACFTIDGQPRNWSDQNDGPALQTVAILAAFDQLDPPTQVIARDVIAKNLSFLLDGYVYKDPTTNLWEELEAQSFFALSAYLRCFQAIKDNVLGIPFQKKETDEAIDWLQGALASHWNGTIYRSILPEPDGGYDPNIDIICASLYGAIPCTDTRLLATAAHLRSQWADDGSPLLYPINAADRAQGLGPLLGRYPGDFYDGDTLHPVPGGHPWALCSCNLAELYYRVANEIDASQSVPLDALSQPFFSQVGVDQGAGPADAASALRTAGDAILQAVIYHSDHLELSEQYDGQTGYEKSVKNLTWSYGAFLSAVRAKTGQSVKG